MGGVWWGGWGWGAAGNHGKEEGMRRISAPQRLCTWDPGHPRTSHHTGDLELLGSIEVQI